MAAVFRDDLEKKQARTAPAAAPAVAVQSAGNNNNAQPTVKVVSGGGSLLNGGASSYPESSAGYAKAPKRSDYDTAKAIRDMYDRTVAEGYKDTYSGNYKKLVDDTIAEINSRNFNYDVNADGFYKNYLETAKRNGKLAAKDSAAKSASLSGGYANSWSQDAAHQIYNMYMQDANDAAADYADRAYARYQDEGTELLNMLGIYQNLDETDYSRARDAKNDYDNLVSQLWSRYVDAVGIDSDRYSADYNAYSDAVTTALSAGDFNKLDSLGVDTSALRAEYNAKLAAYNQSGSGKSGSTSEGDAETGTFGKWVSREENDSGGYTYKDAAGNEVSTSAKGINPYVQQMNRDVMTKGEYDSTKAFSNGYQPNNVDGYRLHDSGEKLYSIDTGDGTLQLNPEGSTVFRYTTRGRGGSTKDHYVVWYGPWNTYIDLTDSYTD
mgnify:CR=1 FL=1